MKDNIFGNTFNYILNGTKDRVGIKRTCVLREPALHQRT